MPARAEASSVAGKEVNCLVQARTEGGQDFFYRCASSVTGLVSTTRDNTRKVTYWQGR